MLKLDEPKEVFSHLGLSQYEARVYYALILEGASEARKLSLKCGVPRTKIYLTLKKLKERNLVYELPESPSKYAAVSPVEAFQRYVSVFKEETAEKVISLMECKELIMQLEEAHTLSKVNNKPRKEEVWILNHKKEILRKIEEILLQANDSVKIVTTQEGLTFLYKIGNKMFDTMIEKDVNIEVLTPINGDASFVVRELKHICSVKHLKVDIPIMYICVDSKLSLLIKLNLIDYELVDEGSLGIVGNDSDLCTIFNLLIMKSAS